MKKLILVINYNLGIDKSETFQSLIAINDKIKDSYDIIIWDNCSIDSNFSKVREFENFSYEGTKKNKGLAQIYNKIIDIVKSNDKYSHLIILDNDSHLTENYFCEFEKSLKKNPEISLFLPKIISNNLVFSPWKVYPKNLKKSKRYDINDFGEMSSENVNAINSGMIISIKYLCETNFYYDKRLGFYGTDDYFMKKYNQKKDCYYLLNYELEHDLSLNNREEIEKVIWRYTDSLKGTKILSEDYNFIQKIPVIIRGIKTSIMKSVQYKNIIFLKIFLKTCLSRTT